MVPRQLVEVLRQRQKFERPPFWNDCSYGIKSYGVEVALNGMTQYWISQKYSLQIGTKVYGGGTHTQTEWWSH